MLDVLSLKLRGMDSSKGLSIDVIASGKDIEQRGVTMEHLVCRSIPCLSVHLMIWMMGYQKKELQIFILVLMLQAFYGSDAMQWWMRIVRLKRWTARITLTW